MTTESNIVASCQGWPPSASGITPAFLAFWSSATNSSKFFGSVPPILSMTALLTQIQLTEWMLIGTASHLPSVVVNFCSAVGMTFAQPSLAASGVMSASLPASA